MAVGMAISAKVKKESHRVVCMLGDGESCEGSVWEAAMSARSYELGYLVAVIDRNKQMMQLYRGNHLHGAVCRQMESVRLERDRD